MPEQNLFFRILGIKERDSTKLKALSTKTGISVDNLKYYNETNILPSGDDLLKICQAESISEFELMLKLGVFNEGLIKAISLNSNSIVNLIRSDLYKNGHIKPEPPLQKFSTAFGQLYQGDCMDLLSTIPNNSVDLIFADPPFNLNKDYPSKINDGLSKDEYLSWCESWIIECIRILKDGGSFFLWNLPKWNSAVAPILNSRLNFRHWIAVDIKYRLPIQGRLYPSHYSLLYYCKGPKPKTFKPDRLPMEICSSCKKEIKDYGGYKNKMNPEGINLSDVWTDIPPVRHDKYKKRKDANELSLKLLDRIIEMASEEGDLVFDPFGGAGTTYVAAELKKRKWIGIEIGPVEDIVNRFKNIKQDREYLHKIREKLNRLFLDEDKRERKKRGLWIPEDFNSTAVDSEDTLF